MSITEMPVEHALSIIMEERNNRRKSGLHVDNASRWKKIDSRTETDVPVDASLDPNIPPEGNISAKIALVGEAGGEQEEILHRPFVGKAGQLLNQCLLAAGIPRSSLYLTNVVKEKPDRNDIVKYREKHPDRYLAWKGFLKRELSAFEGNLIVALGDTALEALTGLGNITRRRGSIYESTLVPGKKVLATIHPAAALRRHALRYFIMRDLMVAKEEAEYPEIRMPEMNLRIAPSIGGIMNYLGEIERQGFCAFDIENTMSGHLTHIGLGLSESDAMSIPLIWGNMDYFNPEDELRILIEVGRILENGGITKIGHNIVHDATIMWRRYGIVVAPVDDTMVAATVLNPDMMRDVSLPAKHSKAPNFPVGLDFLTSWYTRMNYYKDERLSINDETHSRYNAMDCCATLSVWNNQKIELEKIGNMQAYRKQIGAFHVLLYASARGIRVDNDEFEKSKRELNDELERLENELKLIDGNLNPSSPKSLMSHFYGRRGIRPYKSRKTHRPTIDEIALSRLACRGIREAKLIVEIKRLSRKLMGEYHDIEIGGDSRFRISYNPSNDFSDMDGMLMKDMFVVDPGCIFVELNKEMAEYEIIARISGDRTMIDALEQGIDLHSLTASAIYGKKMDEIMPEEREFGERVNRFFRYNLSAIDFALSHLISYGESDKIRGIFLGLYENIPKFWEYVGDSIGHKKALTNLMGRTRMFLDRPGSDLLEAGCAFIVKSTVADILRQAESWYWKRMQEENAHGEILGVTGTSLIMQFPLIDTAAIMNELAELKNMLEPELKWEGGKWRAGTTVRAGFSLGRAMMKVNLDTVEK